MMSICDDCPYIAECEFEIDCSCKKVDAEIAKAEAMMDAEVDDNE
jgi:hypothetical protein